jgi:spermidine/putrescine transport system permease protein
MPGLLAAMLIVFIPTIGDYVTPRLVGGSDGTMIANMIYAQIFDLNNRPMGAALAVMAMGIVGWVILWVITRLRAWIWVNDRLGGGGWAVIMTLAIALAEIALIGMVFVHGPHWFGAAGSVFVLAIITGFVSICILLRLPKGRIGI